MSNIAETPSLLLASNRPLFKLTNINLGSAWFSLGLNKDWSDKSLGLETLPEELDTDQEKQLVHELEFQCLQFEKKLRKMEDLASLRDVFESKLDVKRNFAKDTLSLAYNEMRCVVLDRILWLKEGCQDTRSQIPFYPPKAIPKEYLEYFNLAHGWKAIAEFKSAYTDVQAESQLLLQDNDSSNTITSTEEQLISLLKLEDKTRYISHLATVQANIARAAFGLRFIAQDNPETPFESVMNDLATKANVRDESLLKDLEKPSRADVMKVIFLCCAFTPLVLLSKKKLNAKNNLSFPKIIQALRYPFHNSDPKHWSMVKDMWGLVFKLAASGGSTYTPSAYGLWGKWQADDWFNYSITKNGKFEENWDAILGVWNNKFSTVQTSVPWLSLYEEYVKRRLKHSDSNTSPAIPPTTTNQDSPTVGSERQRDTTKRKTNEKADANQSSSGSGQGPSPAKKKKVKSNINGVYKFSTIETKRLDQNVLKDKRGGHEMIFNVYVPRTNSDALVFEQIGIKIPKYKSMKKYYDMLEMMQNKRCSHDDQERPADVITKAEWAKLDKAARRAKFAQRSIHVVGGGKTPIMPDFECWNVESLSSYMDIKTEREVIDLLIEVTSNDDNVRRRRASIESALDHINGEQTAVLNYLDIKMEPNRILLDSRHLEDGQVYANSHFKDYTWETEYYNSSSAWALISLKGAISDTHIDAGGFATFVEIVEGQKIWLIGTDSEANVPSSKSGFDISKSKWQALVLNKGDQLYMAPGSRHFVVTTEHTLMAGGHFHCKETLDRSLYSMTLQHYFGPAISNEVHWTAGTTFHRLAAIYGQLIVSDTVKDLLPKQPDLAALFLILVYLPALGPADEDFLKSWQNMKPFASDQDYAIRRYLEVVKKTREFQTALKEQHETFSKCVKACEAKLKKEAKNAKDSFWGQTLDMYQIEILDY